MRKLSCLTYAFAIISSLNTVIAGEVRLEGDVGYLPLSASEGTINVVFDLDPLDSFRNGGVSFSVVHDSLGGIEFTGATILNPGGRWTLANATTSSNRVILYAFSVGAPGLPQGGQNVLFAAIQYVIKTPAFGLAKLGYEVDEEALIDGRNFGYDVTANYMFAPNVLVNYWADPEPSSLVLALGFVGLVLHRRNG